MSNTWGNRVKLTIFGESHGQGIGVVIDGLPAGIEPNFEELDRQMARRAPGNQPFATERKESDQVEILSGLYNGKTTGAPLCGILRNQDTRSHDYNPELPRPGTADLTAHLKFKGFQDHRGGGHFSGRLTAPLTFAGSLARQILAEQGIHIGAHIQQIHNLTDEPFHNPSEEELDTLSTNVFPVRREEVRVSMLEAIARAKDERDSLGGIVECAALGLPAGIGSPFFNSLESSLASMLFSIPAIKGVEFGSGFGFATLKGSEANDPIRWKEKSFVTETNHNGGINGGISNGMPLIFRVAVKPTASIGKPQTTVNLNTLETQEFVVQGRHDPSIVPRSVVVVESALALCLLDAMA